MLLVPVLLGILVVGSECVVNFKRSMLIDQYDLEGVQEYKVNKVCDYGCHIWASIPPGTEESAKNIHIDDDFFFNLAEVATMYDKSTTQKKPMYIDSDDSFSIFNFNPNQTTTPLLIYVVSTRASDLNTAEVYDAHNMNRNVFPAKQVTIMSAAPYTVYSNQSNGGNSVTIRATGFDDVDDGNKDDCYQLMSLTNSTAWPGFSLEVSSPLLSLAFDYKKYPDAYLHLSTEMGNTGQLDLQQPGFVTSPGYVGCSSGEVFRSSLYSKKVAVMLTSASSRHVYLNADVHTDQAHAVSVIDQKTSVNYPLFGNGTQSQEFFTTGLAINWNGAGTPNAFAIRYSSVPV